MSKFSERFKTLLEDSGMKIYQLAKNAELDRTTIQRTLTGDRLPNISFVEKLCDFLRVSPTERAELLELYSISKIGEKVFYRRQYIKNLIERIATIHIASQGIGTQKSVHLKVDETDGTVVYNGLHTVNNLIRDILEDEVLNNTSPEINIFVPFKFSFIFDFLHQMYLSKNGQINIKNIIRLFKNPNTSQNSNYNLDMLSHVMPFSFSAGNGYQPYYYYDNYDNSNDIALLMPYFIITGRYLVTLSDDITTAILYNNENVINIYKAKFEAAIIKSRPLTFQHNNCDGMLLSYLEAYNNSGQVSHVIEPQPCFAFYYTDELIRTHLREELENREIILELLYKLYKPYSSNHLKPTSIFSIDGLNYFAETGVLADLPTQFAVPFSLSERIMLLTKIKEDIVNDTYKVYAANPENFIVPTLSIQLYKNNRLDFYAADNNGSISSAYIEERSITEAFLDFFESLPDSNLILSKDKTISIIDRLIYECYQNIRE